MGEEQDGTQVVTTLIISLKSLPGHVPVTALGRNLSRMQPSPSISAPWGDALHQRGAPWRCPKWQVRSSATHLPSRQTRAIVLQIHLLPLKSPHLLPSTCKHLGHIGTEFCSELWDLPTCGMTTVSRPGLLLAQQCPGFSSAAVTEFEQPLP